MWEAIFTVCLAIEPSACELTRVYYINPPHAWTCAAGRREVEKYLAERPGYRWNGRVFCKPYLSQSAKA